MADEDRGCLRCHFRGRRCPPKCDFKPHFNLEDSQKYHDFNAIFGITKLPALLTRVVGIDEKKHAVNNMVEDARMWINNPTLGCYGVLSQRLADTQKRRECLAEKTHKHNRKRKEQKRRRRSRLAAAAAAAAEDA